MSVIIRLQNLPWSANALDIRQFFKGLSIPEGGVHIVGGEMGDAFIAFSTDEDARQGMMRDREAINGVQVRLLLSSRAEMQKVIETARQQSLLALKNANLVPPTKVTTLPAVVPKNMVQTPQPPVISASSFQNILNNPLSATPSFLAYQQQAGITLIPDPNSTVSSTKNNRNDSDDSETRHSRDRRRSESRERRRSRTRSRERNSVFRRRRERSRERSRDRDWQSGRRSSRRSRSRAHSRDHSRDRSRNRSRERSRSHRDNRRNSRDNTSRPRNIEDIKPKPIIASWNITNAYQTNYNSLDSTSKTLNSAKNQLANKISDFEGNCNKLDSAPKNMMMNNNQFTKLPGQMGSNNKAMTSISKLTDSLTSPVAAATVSVTAVATTFQKYNSTNPSLTSLNNYSLSSLLNASTSNDSYKGFALQNPYTTALKTNTAVEESSESATTTTTSSAIPGIFVEKKSDAIPAMSNTESAVVNALPQEPIAFSTVNPYEQMYPNLFAQAAALGNGQKTTVQSAKKSLLSLPDSSPKADADDIKSREVDPNETNCVKISNMCSRTTYSDLRKFFVGLFIPHNGIKMLNDKHGLRVGIAYVQFSRQSSVNKALCRTNNLLKGKSVIIDAVAEEEFEEAEDSFRPNNSDKSNHGGGRDNDSDQENTENPENSGYSVLNPFKKIICTEPFSVLYIEDIPALATEQDIIKMFSSYSLYDILLLSSPENRREFVAHVRFSREEDAKSAYEDKAHHQIGYRRLRVRPGTIADMDNAKEKIRLANEQLMKEEQAAKVAAEEEETKLKLEKLITEQITREEEKEKQQQNIISMDLTQEEEAEDENDDVVETTIELDNDNENYDNDEDVDNNDAYGDDGDNSNTEQLPSNDNYSYQGNNMDNNFSKDPRRSGPNNNVNVPSIFDLNPMNTNPNPGPGGRNPAFNDPRLRNDNARGDVGGGSGPNNINSVMGAKNFNNFNLNFNSQHTNPPVVNSIERNFVILKNCEYNTRINDVAQLLITANLGLKHIEPLRNERQLPTGEFIVEFRRTQDAETAIKHFHNIQFRNRSLRVFPILPQEIADRLAKPFLSYIPGGNGPRINNSGGVGGGGNDIMGRINFNNPNSLLSSSNISTFLNNSRFGTNTQQQRGGGIGVGSGGDGNVDSFRDGDNVMPQSNLNRGGVGNMGNNNKLNVMPNNINNNNDNNINNTSGGIPEKFQRPGCVLSLENVPYKAQVSEILRFFQGFDLIADDIIRRFNDDGSPTGDARVAFNTPDQAKAAFEAKKRKQIFGRTIFLNIM